MKVQPDTEKHISLYRKYRPKNFSEVRGQDHVVKALEGAIQKGTIPHALLFAGTRGTGKTSIARIFATAIGAHQLDIYEIDAASNRGIDDIRELREAVHTLPYESEHKVYIIDEVHMLTKEAFNALLKTLEEPPKHVVFILATTEAGKLLDTILSRCQVFTFRTPSRAILREAILDTAKKEKFKVTEEGAELIALAADGSFRDAFGTLEKVIMASSDEKTEADEIADILGAPKSALIMQLLQSLAERNVSLGLAAIEKAQKMNLDFALFTQLMLERVRAVLLLRHSPGDGKELLVDFGSDDGEQLVQWAKDPKTPFNSQLLSQLLTAANETTRARISSLPLELVVVSLAS